MGFNIWEHLTFENIYSKSGMWGHKEDLTHDSSILKGKIRHFHVSFHSGIVFLVIIPGHV